MNKDIKSCYIDDTIDPTISKYLKNFDGVVNKDIPSDETQNASSLINIIVENDYKIVLIDSDLANEKTNGQQIELLLTQKYPFIFVIVITSHNEEKYNHYVKKYNSRISKIDGKTDKEYYDETLKPLLNYAIDRYERNVASAKSELTQEMGISNEEKQQIDSSMRNQERIVLSKKDLDDIIGLFGEVLNKNESQH